MYCPYHNEDHQAGVEFSKEHILPYAAGGSNQLVIDVCKNSNNQLGSEVDSPMLNSWYFSVERFHRGIKGHGGALPTVEFQGTIDGVPAVYSFSQEQKRLFVKPKVEWKPGAGQQEITINCTDDQLMEILVNINKKIAKRGGNSLDIETLLESAEVKSIPSPKMSVKLTFDVTSFDRAFVKMALGLAHFVIGEKYSRCHEADLLREFLWEPDKDKRGSFPLHGQVWPNADPKLTNVFKYKDFHVLALLNVNPFGFYGLLFGQYCGHIQCSENSEYFAEEVPLGDGWVFLIDPVSRKLRKYGLAEYFNKKQCNALRIAD